MYYVRRVYLERMTSPSSTVLPIVSLFSAPNPVRNALPQHFQKTLPSVNLEALFRR